MKTLLILFTALIFFLGSSLHVSANGLQGFDKIYYLSSKLAALQASDSSWLGKNVNDLETLLLNVGFTAESHYSQYGYKEGLQPNVYFNHSEYIRTKATAMYNSGAYASVDEAEADFRVVWPYDAYQHYLKYGAAEGINPSNSFDESAYLTDKLAALRAESGDWDNKIIDDLRSLFASYGMTVLDHYINYGAAEGLTLTEVPLSEQVIPNILSIYTYYRDYDQDGYGDNSSIKTPVQPSGYALNNLDCNDYDSGIYPSATEICGDGIDQDCDGLDTPSEEKITTYENFHRTRQQLMNYHNLANVIASLPTNSNNANEVIDIEVIDENTIKIKNLGDQTTIIDCYLAGLLLENISVEAGNSVLQTVPWDGTEYEYLVKYKGEYFSQLISVVTPTSQESYERGLFFDGHEAINRIFPFWESFIKVIDNSQNPVKKRMKLHGVDVSVYYSPEFLPFETEEEKNQFVYLMFTVFHQVWCHYQGFPYKTYEFLFLPVMEEWGDYLNMETNAGIAFSSDMLERDEFRPGMYAHSVNESWFPYSFFFDFTPNAVWVSKTMCENVALNIGNDIPLEFDFVPLECLVNNPDIPLAEVYGLHVENNGFSCARYSYVKARPMYRMIVNQYVENTSKESKSFYSKLYEKLLLENPSFNPENPNSLPFSTPLAKFKEILGEIVQDSVFIDTLFDKYVYHGQAYDDWDPGIFTSKIIPKIYPLFSYEEEFNKLRDSLVNTMSQENEFVGIPF